MNSGQTGTLSTAQHATLPLLKADRPLSSWTEEARIPDQFFRPATNTTVVWGGARQLLLAVLDNAVAAVLRYRDDHSRRGRRLFKEALDWFQSADRQWLYSFENICTHLDVDAEYLRRGVKRLSDPATVPSVPFLTAPRERRRTNHHLTGMRGGDAGRNGQGASLVGRTRSSTGE